MTMMPAAEFFQAFQDAGFLTPATLLDASGNPTTEFPVRDQVEESPVLGGHISGQVRHILYAPAQAPALQNGSGVLIGGTRYTVRGISAKYDGTLARAELREVRA